MLGKDGEAKLIREELSFIGRYLLSISPKLAKHKELTERKKELKKKLKTLPKQPGSNPGKFTKYDDRMLDVVGIIGTNRDKIRDSSYQTARTNRY